MKNFFLTMLLASFLVSCNQPDLDMDGEQFYAQNMITDTPYMLRAKKIAEGKKCVIWAENGSGVTKEKAEKIANTYDKVIRPKIVDAFSMKDITYKDESGGYHFDDILDFANALAGKNDKKLTILLLDIKDGFKDPKTDPYVAGYFYSGNFYKKNQVNTSNECDMIYVDTYPGLSNEYPQLEQQTYATFAHELQHLINFTTTVLVGRENSEGVVSLMDTWIDEGLSSQAEHIYHEKYLEDKCRQFNKDEKGTIAKGNNFFVWGNHPEEPNAILDEYSTVYLFFRWLYLQADNNLKATIFKDIETADKSDYTVITTVAKRIKSEWASWDTLLSSWFTANYYPADPVYGYKDPFFYTGENAIKVKPIKTDNNTISLYPGEGVYSRINGSFTTPSKSGNICYKELDNSASKALLTFNASTNCDNKTAISETGTLTGVAASVSFSTNSRTLMAEDTQTYNGPYAIDARDYSRIFGRNK